MRAMRLVVGWAAFAVAAAVVGGAPAHAADGNSISGTVWWDLDRDGCICSGEAGLAGVELAVTWAGEDDTFGTADDVDLEALTTDVDGRWFLDGLEPGIYRVGVTTGVPAALTQTYDPDDGVTDEPASAGVADVVVDDSDDPVTLAEQDFGFAGVGTIGDDVWLDRDGDGVMSTGTPDSPFPEFGLGGVDVVLTWYGLDDQLGSSDDLSATVTSTPDGVYLRDGFPTGRYRIAVQAGTLPAGVVSTFDPDGGGDDVAEVTLTDEAPYRDDVDFAYRGTGSIGGQIVWDRDATDGLSEPDVGLPGTPVLAIWWGPSACDEEDPWACSPAALFAESADRAGRYLFDGLPAGSYVVQTPPDLGFDPGGMPVNFDEDSGAIEPDAVIAVDLAPAAAHSTADFGFVGAGRIGGVVYLDRDGDGTQGPAEAGVAGQRVDLVWGACGCDPDGELLVVSTVTDANGEYEFANLSDGPYRVQIVDGLAAAAINTGDPDGDDVEGAANESSVDLSVELEGSSAMEQLDQDFGYQGTSSIGDSVWLDVNADGVRQAGEPGIGGAAVTVTFAGVDAAFGTGDELDAATTTDPSGAYTLAGLVAGRYRVAPAVAAMTVSADPDGNGDGVGTLDLALGEANLAQDIGLAGTGSLTGRVFDDRDRDGTVDDGEPGVAGVSVVVTWNPTGGAVALAVAGPPAGPVALTATTAVDGTWHLDRLPPGAFEVHLDVATVPAGASATTDGDVSLVLAAGAAGSVVHGLVLQASPPPPPPTNAPPTTAADPGELPATGGDSNAPLVIGIVLVAVGAVALGLSRSRKRRA